MGPLTPNAAAVLVAAARLVGEHDAGVHLIDVHNYLRSGEWGAGIRHVTVRGLKTHSVPSLVRRGYAKWALVGCDQCGDYPSPYVFYLTLAGYNEAVRLTGGLGLI